MLQLRHVWREYGEGNSRVVALRDISLDVAEGEHLAIVGPSGSGKSTLLNVMGGVDRVSRGEILFDGVRFDTLDEERLTGFRRGRLAYVFQQYHLIATLTVLENVMLPLVFCGKGDDTAPALTVLEKVGLSHRMSHRPAQLSGGEQQRAAIARALVGNPALILADEPTGNLDQASGRQILSLFEELNREGRAIVVVTHNPDVARRASEIVTVADGQIVARERVVSVALDRSVQAGALRLGDISSSLPLCNETRNDVSL
jgi:putative ABC transport system ATP-binding protein